MSAAEKMAWFAAAMANLEINPESHQLQLAVADAFVALTSKFNRAEDARDAALFAVSHGQGRAWLRSLISAEVA